MGVYIKGMDMPKEGAERCIVIRGNGQVTTFTGAWIDYASASPVPPHGRLIDADALAKSIKDQIELIKLFRNEELDRVAQMIEVGYMQEIANAPTILEAEVEE